MDALLLAAGLGTRLRPLTNLRPKALVEVEGRTLLEINLQRLAKLQVDHVVVNVHHYADMVTEYLQQHAWKCPVSISDERALLLDTGGAIAHAAPLFDSHSPILVHNTDVLEHIDIADMLRQHQAAGNLATLAVSQRNSSRQLLVDSCGQLKGWVNRKSGETIHVAARTDAPNAATDTTPFAFSGIAILDPQLFSLLPPATQPYPIIPEYLRLAAQYRIATYHHDASCWLDVGSPDTLAQAASFIRKYQL